MIKIITASPTPPIEPVIVFFLGNHAHAVIEDKTINQIKDKFTGLKSLTFAVYGETYTLPLFMLSDFIESIFKIKFEKDFIKKWAKYHKPQKEEDEND